MTKPPLRMFETENFKAIRASGKLKFDWLTCFIGNNGVGKSSLIEALETFRDIVHSDLDPAMHRWRGFEHIWNKGGDRKLLDQASDRPRYNREMMFGFEWFWKDVLCKGEQSVTQGPGGNEVFISSELMTRKSKRVTETHKRDAFGKIAFETTSEEVDDLSWRDFIAKKTMEPGQSLMDILEMLDWQFLMLNPEVLGQPKAQALASRQVRLARDGSNLAAYLNEIRALDQSAFDGILEALSYVLPYAIDLQPAMTSELERAFYLKLKEGNFEVPGWLLSTGTLRIVAILACLRHPNPPPLLVIEEIENGLDPRTLHLVVEEIRAAIAAKRTQIILTTHSPYLLDQQEAANSRSS